jgi:hypothetical protein
MNKIHLVIFAMIMIVTFCIISFVNEGLPIFKAADLRYTIALILLYAVGFLSLSILIAAAMSFTNSKKNK